MLQLAPLQPALQLHVPVGCATPWPLHVVASLYWQSEPVNPGLQVVQVWLDEVEHVSAVQFAMLVQFWQTALVVLVQALTWYCPARHVVHVWQTVFVVAVQADCWYWPALHVLHARHWPPER